MKAVRLLEIVSEVTDMVGRVLLDPRHSGRRWRTISTALRLRTRRLRHASAKGRSERIEGFRVEFFDSFGADFLYSEIFVDQEYHFESNVPDPFVIDCGSNVGMATLYFKSRYPAARILCFEASERTFQLLERNVRSNQLEGVELQQKAVSDTEGTADFFVDPDAPGSFVASTDPDRGAGRVERVDLVRLSDFVNEPVHFLKLDVEGAEMAVMREMADSGKLALVQQMAIEYHHHVRPDEDGFSELLALLESHGFGYRVHAKPAYVENLSDFQDILVYAYSKAGGAASSAAIA